MPTKILCVFRLQTPSSLSHKRGGVSPPPLSRTAGSSHGETRCSMTWVVPDSLSRGVQHRAARHTITLPTRVPRDTGLENEGAKKRGLVWSVVFQVDSMWKENSIKQLRTFSVRVYSWSFLQLNKNVFAFVYYNDTRKLKHQTNKGSWRARDQLKNKSLTNFKKKISISNLRSIKPILCKNKHKAFVWAVSHPRFSSTEKWTEELLWWNASIKSPCGPTFHSWDAAIAADTLALMTHAKTEKTQPLQNREMLREKQTSRDLLLCVFLTFLIQAILTYTGCLYFWSSSNTVFLASKK